MTQIAPSYIRPDYLSLWLGRAVARAIARDTSGQILAEAQRKLTGLRAANPHSRPYYDAWQRALDAGPQAVMSLLRDTSEAAQPIRSCSPFAGAITAQEREAVLLTFRAWWAAQPHVGDFLLPPGSAPVSAEQRG